MPRYYHSSFIVVALALLALLDQAQAQAHQNQPETRLERHKRYILDGLDLPARPGFISHAPLLPHSLASAEDLDEPHYWKKRGGIYGGKLVHMELRAQEAASAEWVCITPGEIVQNCFQFLIDPWMEKDIVSASLVVTTSDLSNNLTIKSFQVDEYFGELSLLDRIELSKAENDSLRVHFDMTNTFRAWVRRNERLKLIKIDVTPPITSLSESPFFELTLFEPHDSENPECSGCCVVPFYVNFTEIGWDDWILSPRGFYANYCSDQCSDIDSDDDEISQLIKNAIISSTSGNSKFAPPPPSCVPNYYGSVDFVVALSSRDIRKTRVHGMRALSCSCS